MSRRPGSPRRDSERESSPEAGGSSSAAALSALHLPRPQDSLRHLFLQAFITHRLLPQLQAKLIYKECARVCQVHDADSFQDFVAALEPQLALLGLELKNGNDQETGVPFLALVNTISDPVSKLATELSPSQLVFFRLVVDKIMTAPKMKYAVSVKDATKCAKDAAITPAMSYVQAEALLKSLTFKGWLTYHPGSWLTLAPRAVTELGPYLRDKYAHDAGDEDEVDPDERGYVECQQCRSMVTSGWACPNGQCSVRLHRHCASGALTARNGTCPASITDPDGCKQQWLANGPNKWSGTPVGLLALQDVDDSQDQLDGASDDEPETRTETPRRATRQREVEPTPDSTPPARGTSSAPASSRMAAPTSTAESEPQERSSKRTKTAVDASSSDASDEG